jgi:hypothetical protein
VGTCSTNKPAIKLLLRRYVLFWGTGWAGKGIMPEHKPLIPETPGNFLSTLEALVGYRSEALGKTEAGPSHN